MENEKLNNALSRFKQCNQKETSYAAFISSLTKMIDANVFYLKAICNNDPDVYYDRYFRTSKPVKAHTVVYIDFSVGFPLVLMCIYMFCLLISVIFLIVYLIIKFIKMFWKEIKKEGV